MTRWPDLTALQLVVAVADHGSLSAGARACAIAQPNASRSVARLERRLGLSLLKRSTTGSTLTPAGLLIVDWARPLLDALDDLDRNSAALAGAPGASSIVVAASQTVAEHLLPAWLARLRMAHPDVSLEVRVLNSTEVVDDVLHGRCSVGFVEGPRAPKGVHHLVVAHDELVLVVAPTHAWARRRRPVTRQELAGTPLITREPGSGTRVSLDRALGANGPIRPAMELASNAAVRVAVVAGTGAAVLSRLAVADALGSGSLVEVRMEDLGLHRALRAVWTGPRQLTGSAAELVRLARAGDPGAVRDS